MSRIHPQLPQLTYTTVDPRVPLVVSKPLRLSIYVMCLCQYWNAFGFNDVKRISPKDQKLISPGTAPI